MSTEIVEGKVYLRDTRNGNVHPYEDLLAQMNYMKAFVGGTPEEEASAQPVYNISLTGLDRAAEWDRLAQMSPEERKKELGGKPAPWERRDHLSASDVVARPDDAPEPRKKPATAATQPAVNAPPAPAQPVPATPAPADAEDTVKKAYRMTDKAAPHTYADLKAAGWTLEDLLEKGMMEEVAES